MEKFTTLEGVAAPLRIINVDTDMVIPKQYLKTIKRTGLGKGLFSEKRYKDDGSENPDFVLNKPAYRKARILVADDNFGCGSSREHAPWALMDFGIRCVISTSFGDIVYNNCFKNRVLPIKVSPLALVQADRHETRLPGHEPGALLHQLQHLGLVLLRNLDGRDLGDDVVARADFWHGTCSSTQRPLRQRPRYGQVHVSSLWVEFKA